MTHLDSLLQIHNVSKVQLDANHIEAVLGMGTASWKEKLAGQMPAELAGEIDTFETQIHLRKQGKMEEKLFAETRLRRGVYGQRYDNGQRYDGTQTQLLHFPDHQTKGPDTVWHAPGMMRIKIPFGGLTAEQMEVLADVAEEYSEEVLHVTTRQDFQIHFVHLEDTPDLMRRLAAVGITTREACGNSVRNVTACPPLRRLPHRDLRRNPLCPSRHALPARASRLPRFRAQVQDRFLRLPARSLRPDQHARHGRHRRGKDHQRRGKARL